MVESAVSIDEMSLKITQEIRVSAPLATTFAALLEQLGPGNQHPDGTAMAMKLEAWPGGRWFRDLGNSDGHWWGTVQAIRRNTLLEITGPLFMSYPVANNVQYRLSEESGETVIRFCHSGFGLISEAHRTGVNTGWSYIHQQVKKRSEAAQA
jgi:uncharacterized protein YndB with AHSA1/START domain